MMSDLLNSLLMEAQPLPYDATKAARAKEIDTWDFSTGQQHFRLRATRVSKGGLFNAYRHSGTIPAIFYLNQIDDNGKVVKNITKITKPLAVVATVAEIITTELEGLKQAPVVMLRVPKSTNLEAVQRLVNRYIKKNSPQFEIPGIIDIEGEKNAYAAIMRKGADADVAAVFGVKTGDVTIRDLIKGGAGAEEAGKKLADKIEDQTKKDQVKPSGATEPEKKLAPELVGKKGLSGLQMDYEEYALTAIMESGIGLSRARAMKVAKLGNKGAYTFIEIVLGVIRTGPTEADAIKKLRELYNIDTGIKTLADALKWAIVVGEEMIDASGVFKKPEKTEPSGTSVLGLATPKAMSPIDKVINAKDFATGEGVTATMNQRRLASAASQITYAVGDLEAAIVAYNKVNHFSPTSASNKVVSKYRGFRDVLIADIKKYSEMTGGAVTEKDFMLYAQSVAKKYDMFAVFADYKAMNRIPEKGGVAPKETATIAPTYAPDSFEDRWNRYLNSDLRQRRLQNGKTSIELSIELEIAAYKKHFENGGSFMDARDLRDAIWTKLRGLNDFARDVAGVEFTHDELFRHYGLQTDAEFRAQLSKENTPEIRDNRTAGEVVEWARKAGPVTLDKVMTVSAAGTVVTIAIGNKTSFVMDVAGSSMGGKYKFTMTKKVEGIRSPALKETSDWKVAVRDVIVWLIKHETALRAQTQPVAPEIPAIPSTPTAVAPTGPTDTKVKVGDVVAISAGTAGQNLKVTVLAAFKYKVGSVVREFFVHKRPNVNGVYSITEERTRMSATKFHEADLDNMDGEHDPMNPDYEGHAKKVLAELIKRVGAKAINDAIDARPSFGRDLDTKAKPEVAPAPSSDDLISTFFKSEAQLGREATMVRNRVKMIGTAMEAGDLETALTQKAAIDRTLNGWLEYIKTMFPNSQLAKVPAMEFMIFFSIPTEEDIRTYIDHVKKTAGIDALPTEQAVIELAAYINGRIPSDLSKYVWARPRKLIGEWTIDVLMLGAGKNASDTAYFNSMWAHFSMDPSTPDGKKFVLAQKHYQNKMRRPSFKDKGSLVKAADDLLAWINKNKAAFLSSGLITDQSDKMTTEEMLADMSKRDSAAAKFIEELIWRYKERDYKDRQRKELLGVDDYEADAANRQYHILDAKVNQMYDEIYEYAEKLGYTGAALAPLYRKTLSRHLASLLGK